MTHHLFYPLGWFYHFLSQTFFPASEIARWPQTLRRVIISTNETRKNAFFLKGLHHLSLFIKSKNLSPALFSRWVWGWLALFARRLSTQSRVRSKVSPEISFGPVADEERWRQWWQISGVTNHRINRDYEVLLSRVTLLIASRWPLVW